MKGGHPDASLRLMRRTIEPTGGQAAAGAHPDKHAAARARVAVRPLHSLEDVHACSALFADVWGTGERKLPIHPDLIRALVHAGNYAAGAFDDDGRLVGGIVGFLGLNDDGVHLHSHILGVSEAHRGSNVGFALKQDQRTWALERDLETVTWTFDPLVSRNAYFNIQKLGAEPALYHESFYGTMNDEINAGDETDRLLMVWKLESARALQASDGGVVEPDVDALIRDGAGVALSSDVRGAPVRGDLSGSTLLCAVPSDIVAMRRNDGELALRWRRELRAALTNALDDGYHVTGFSRAGWYVFERDDS